MTKKERKKVYLKVHERISKDFPTGHCYGVCSALADEILGDCLKYDRIPTIAPEFELFKHDRIVHGLLWFELGNLEERQTALLLAAEMCN